MFRIGQKVVCIKEPKGRVNDLGLPDFVKGEVYTVDGLKTVAPYGDFIHVEERPGPQLGHISGFRPLVSRKTDLSIFQRMLTPSPSRELCGND